MTLRRDDEEAAVSHITVAIDLDGSVTLYMPTGVLLDGTEQHVNRSAGLCNPFGSVGKAPFRPQGDARMNASKEWPRRRPVTYTS